MAEEGPEGKPAVDSSDQLRAAIEAAALEAPSSSDKAATSAFSEAPGAPGEIHPDERLRAPELSAPKTAEREDSGSGPEAGPDAAGPERRTGRPPIEEIVGSDARAAYVILPEHQKSALRQVFEEALERPGFDILAAKIAVWKGKLWDGMRIASERRKEGAIEKLRDAAVDTGTGIESDLKFAEESGILTPELRVKVEEEKVRAKAQVEKHTQEIEDVRSNRTHYENNRQEIIDTIAGKWKGKIGANERLLKEHADVLKGIEGDVALQETSHREVKASLDGFKERQKTVKSEALKGAIGAKIQELEVRETALAESIKSMVAWRREEEGTMQHYEKESVKLRQFHDRILGRTRRAEGGEATAEVGPHGAEERESADATVESGSVSGLPFRDYLDAWNSAYKSLSLKVTGGLDVPLEREEATRRLRSHLERKYPSRKKIIQKQIESFRIAA